MCLSQINSCPYCPARSLDPMDHHALTCKHGGEVVARHNKLRDVFVESCRRACIGVQVEVGGKYGSEERRKRPTSECPCYKLDARQASVLLSISPLRLR